MRRIVKSRRLSSSICASVLCLAVPGLATAQETAPASEQAVTVTKVASAAPLTAAGASVTTGVAPALEAQTPPAPGADTVQWEDSWEPWNTGGEEAGLGFGFFGHLGLSHRFNDPPAAVNEINSRTGLRVGITGIFRPIRWFGFGVGYEHADLERDRTDIDEVSFDNTYRDLNTLWVDARVYPLRFDPFALYVSIAGGPSWQSLDTDKVLIDDSTGGQAVGTRCSGSDSAAFGMKGAVGAELALQSGALFWAETGPDYMLLSDETLDSCEIGAGDAAIFGFRAGFAVGFEKTRLKKELPPAPPKDQDLDTILDVDDACPAVAGLPNADKAKNGCPPPVDTDGDGIFDDVDACKDVPGIANVEPAKHGCPPPKDTDGDTVIDDVDACKEIPGLVTTDPATNGCPGDTDGDGFRDDQDACPQEKGVDDADPSKRGCPKLVRVTATEIIILEQVQFDTGKATIKPASDALLDSVAAVLKEHPEIRKVEIQGHTDNKGSKPLNKTLSQNRANSVQKALEKRGVESARLTAKGYGQDVPVADNKDEEGRAKNRRVQFVVTEKAPPAPKNGAAPLLPPAGDPVSTPPTDLKAAPAAPADPKAAPAAPADPKAAPAAPADPKAAPADPKAPKAAPPAPKPAAPKAAPPAPKAPAPKK